MRVLQLTSEAAPAFHSSVMGNRSATMVIGSTNERRGLHKTVGRLQQDFDDCTERETCSEKWGIKLRD